jgi:hypothetical protein
MSGDGELLDRLREEIEREGGLLEEVLTPVAAGPPAFGSVVERVERLGSARREYALVLESVLEGYLLHYGRSRLIATDDHDLRLLAGDYMYAIGLNRLARLGDLGAVRELGDLISLCARAHCVPADGTWGDPWRTSGALWATSTLALAAGAGSAQEPHQRIAASAEQMLSAARDRARRLGIASHLERALIAFDEAASSPRRRT